jgi:hypothetical protein
MKRILITATLSAIFLIAALPKNAHAQFDELSVFVGYRVSTHTLTNPYFTLRGPEAGESSTVTVPSYYMSFGRMYIDHNEYIELSTYAIDFLYQLILVGSDVNLSAPFIDDDKTMRYAELDFLRFMFSTSYDVLPFSVGAQGGLLNFGIYSNTVPNKLRDVTFDRPNLRFSDEVSMYYGLNVGKTLPFFGGRDLYANVQYDWHFMFKEGGDSGKGNRISAFVHVFPIWDSVRASVYYRQNSAPYLDFQQYDATYKNRSIGFELTYHITSWR